MSSYLRQIDNKIIEVSTSPFYPNYKMYKEVYAERQKDSSLPFRIMAAVGGVLLLNQVGLFEHGNFILGAVAFSLPFLVPCCCCEAQDVEHCTQSEAEEYTAYQSVVDKLSQLDLFESKNAEIVRETIQADDPRVRLDVTSTVFNRYNPSNYVAEYQNSLQLQKQHLDTEGLLKDTTLFLKRHDYSKKTGWKDSQISAGRLY